MKTFTRSTLATLITALLSGQALAADEPVSQEKEIAKTESKQDKQKAKESSLEVIEVTGFIDSLDRADRYKKNSDTFLDAISAEDVGELPADNIGDALFGLPGVDMNFEEGEATDIIIGGLGGEYNQIQVNGANVPGMNDTGGQAGASSLSGFSTALVSGIEVVKSGIASADEGALGGTIKIRNWKPLTFKETRFQLGATAVHHENSGETDGQFNVLYGDRSNDESFGWVFGATVEEKSTGNEQATVPSGWRSQNLDGSDDKSNEVLMPTSLGYKINKTDIERNNLLLGLQYKLDDFDFGFNYNYTKFDRTIEQDSIRVGRPGGQYLPADQQVLDPWSTSENDSITHIARAGLWLANHDANKGAFTNMDRNALSRVEENQNVKFDVNWFATDNLSVQGSIGYALSTFAYDPSVVTKSAVRNRDSVLWNTEDGLATFKTINREAADTLRAEGTLEGTEWAAFDINDQSTWDILTGDLGDQALDPAEVEFRRVNSSTAENESENLFAQLDFTYFADIDLLDSLQFGVKYNDQTIERKQGDPDSGRWSGWNGHLNLADFETHTTVGEDIFGGGYINPGTWLSVTDADELRDAAIGNGTRDADGNVVWPGYGLDAWPNYYNAHKTFNRDFDTLAAYLQANFSGDDFNGNFGVRFVRDDTKVTGYSPYDVDGPNYPFLDENGDPKYVNGKGNPIYPGNSSMYINPIDNPGLDSYVDYSVLDDLTNLNNYQQNVFKNTQNFALPSFNFRYSLTDDDNMFLRFAAARSMARQPMKYTSAALTVRLPGESDDGGFGDDSVVSIRGENPTMEPTMANSASIGFEWYYGKASSLTLAYNHKHLMGVRSQFEQRFEPGTYPDVNNVIPEAYEDLPVVLRLKEANGSGDVNTTEVSWKHNFSSLDGWLGKTGFATNYTYTDSYITAPISQIKDDGSLKYEGDIRLPSAARHASNTQLYFQGEQVTVRLAYTFRDNRLQNRSTLAQENSTSTKIDFKAAEYADYVRNLDFSLNYKILDGLKLNFNVNNILDNDSVRTLSDGTLVSTIRTGRQYKLSALYQF